MSLTDPNYALNYKTFGRVFYEIFSIGPIALGGLRDVDTTDSGVGTQSTDDSANSSRKPVIVFTSIFKKGDISWQAGAPCEGMPGDIFFPEKGGSTRDAKSVCKTCKVRRECLEYALAYDERFGIWGGLSERERRDIKQNR